MDQTLAPLCASTRLEVTRRVRTCVLDAAFRRYRTSSRRPITRRSSGCSRNANDEPRAITVSQELRKLVQHGLRNALGEDVGARRPAAVFECQHGDAARGRGASDRRFLWRAAVATTIQEQQRRRPRRRFQASAARGSVASAVTDPNAAAEAAANRPAFRIRGERQPAEPVTATPDAGDVARHFRVVAETVPQQLDALAHGFPGRRPVPANAIRNSSCEATPGAALMSATNKSNELGQRQFQPVSRDADPAGVDDQVSLSW